MSGWASLLLLAAIIVPTYTITVWIVSAWTGRSGIWIRKNTSCQCKKPIAASAQQGSLWRCKKCGTLWEVEVGLYSTSHFWVRTTIAEVIGELEQELEEHDE